MSSKNKSTTLKYLVIGDSGVGKTSLLVRYCENTFQTDYLSTIGVDFKIKRIQCKSQPITLNIWDTAGQQRFKNITKSFYKGAHGIVLTYSITDPKSYSHIEKWIQQIRQSGNENVAMILVGSKSDLQVQRKVSQKQGEELAEQYNIEWIQTSAKEDSNIEKVFQKLTERILEKPNFEVGTKDTIPIEKHKQHERKNQNRCC